MLAVIYAGLGFLLVRYIRGPALTAVGLVGRLLVALVAGAFAWLLVSTLLTTGRPGTLVVTIIYVTVDVAVQYLLALGLALLVVQRLPGRRFFRVVFLLPMMITPVGVAYLFRMLTDTSKGPLYPLWNHFGLSELLARIHALLRRAALRDGGDASGVLRFADLELIPAAREARRGGWSIDLTGMECDLLELFMRNARRVLTRERIFDEVWGYDLRFASNSLNVYVGYLRRKTEVGGRPRLIHTVRGVGYVLREA